ncbi:acetyl/propionyl/methylcrotonyl-CoA carboxylase subunit alpha [Bosea thiooxidans]|nr:biotin carboxylase N-terminal domain-containing protein [Bosea sp. (in: a-proteobacteria)]
MSSLATAPRPIRAVLIANRGEIACRVIATCRRLGLKSIAVYSDADAGSLAVKLADQAVRIGPPPAAQSYLNIPAVIDAALASGADAVHPGYGFLSENAAFAQACADAGLIFVGPSPAAIAAMGSKIEAKKIANAAGVPTVPGYLGEDQSLERLSAEAERVGYPVLIKASAGGGGRGMRRVHDAGDFAGALQSAKAEARSAFGDDAVLLEKLVTNPRHLEVQLMGDEHGNLVHVFERDCSVQRNNQKVFEEAPAPHLSDEIRGKLYERSLRLGRQIGYTCAGTIEFIMSGDSEEPYFLEMNTRLQVEHPVTEAISGIDLVEWQLRVAAGLPLPLAQNEIHLRGHAIEARIAAERPDKGFQPAIGTVSVLHVPPGTRFDTGIREGSTIGLHYDSMVAKLIVHGPTREAAVAKLATALGELAILGVGTNTAFLKACVEKPGFRSGHLTTDFLGQTFPDGWTPPQETLDRLRADAAFAWVEQAGSDRTNPWERSDAFRVTASGRPASAEVRVSDEFGEAVVTLFKGPQGTSASLDGGPRFDIGSSALLSVEGQRVLAAEHGLSIDAHCELAIAAALSETDVVSDDDHLTAPLPGVVMGLFVAAGDTVEAGQSLMQIEAMKLIHTLAAPRAGVIARIHCGVGDTVGAGAPVIDIDPQNEE